MGSIFGGPKKDPDQAALIAEQRRKMKEQKAEIESRKHARRRGQQGRQSLITTSEKGIPSAQTNAQPTRTSLG